VAGMECLEPTVAGMECWSNGSKLHYSWLSYILE